jgi:hypothetical protein
MLKNYKSSTKACVENYTFDRLYRPALRVESNCGRKNSKYIYISWNVVFFDENIKRIDSHSVYNKVLRKEYIEMNKFLKNCTSTPTPTTFSIFYGIRYDQFGFGSKLVNKKRIWYKIK